MEKFVEGCIVKRISKLAESLILYTHTHLKPARKILIIAWKRS